MFRIRMSERPSTLIFAFAVICLGISYAADFAYAQASVVQPRNVRSEETWTSIKPDLFGDVEIRDGSHLLAMETPTRAEDAALVPLSIISTFNSNIKRMTVVVDENPAPLAAVFEFGPAAGDTSISTRIRINSYSFVRVIAETNDGELYMVKTFVKASGGCSAPSSKDMDAALARLGKMKIRQFMTKKAASSRSSSSRVREAQLMIRHPNNSGFQMDQLTMLYIPPRFIDMIEVKLGGELILRVEGGISLSEDPNIRFHYVQSGASEFSVVATDTDGSKFSEIWSLTGS